MFLVNMIHINNHPLAHIKMICINLLTILQDSPLVLCPLYSCGMGGKRLGSVNMSQCHVDMNHIWLYLQWKSGCYGQFDVFQQLLCQYDMNATQPPSIYFLLFHFPLPIIFFTFSFPTTYFLHGWCLFVFHTQVCSYLKFYYLQQFLHLFYCGKPVP